uniref:Uncharacterized protein n=1 Tax=Kalanchoe fedtschenkoi TaxID=63787 RepID=A0A7N0UE21_KALFE
MAADHGAQKRSREDVPEIDSPGAKKLRHGLFDMLDEPELEPSVLDLDSIMKSLEEEISLSASPVLDSQGELGFLLGASDDELGLPPPRAAAGREEDAVEVLEIGGFGDIWGFEEAAPAFGAAAYGVGGGGDDGEYLALDGLFDFSDVGCGSTEFSWWSESMPAQ